jgi:hypothetical protein
MDDRGSGLRLYVWAMGVLALVAAVWVVGEWRDLATLEQVAARDRATAQGEFATLANGVETLAGEKVDPQREAQSGDKSNFQQFLEGAARESRIPASALVIDRQQVQRNATARYVETSFNVRIGKATRQQVADFCYRIEYYRSYLKIRHVKLTREPKATGDDWKNTVVRVAYREPLTD